MPQNTECNCLMSDTVSCACPEVMDALVHANNGIAVSYGIELNNKEIDGSAIRFVGA